jgi:hypothetical protein
MKIAIMMEGNTEVAFIDPLRGYLRQHLAGRMPKLDPVPYHSRIPTGHSLHREVRLLLNGRDSAAHVIALTDVYTGSRDFTDAADAKRKMRTWVGNEPRFHPHAAQHDFEAWLLPYWLRIQELAGSNRTAPSPNPESVNHGKPPSRHLAEIFRAGSRRRSYVKTRDAAAILRDADLSVAIAACAELRALVNTILTICGATAV